MIDELESHLAEEARQSTDLGNAERLIDRFGDDLLYVADWDKWLVWNGRHWVVDNHGTAHQKARQVAREIWDEAFSDGAKMNWAKQSQSRRGLEAMVAVARRDPRIVVGVEQLDQHPELLVVGNGTVELGTGMMRPSARGDLITRGSDVVYDPSAECPEWEAFLARVLPDPDVRDYLQRAFGYSLTGWVSEEKLFFCYGTGANGKSIVAEVLRRLLGDYARHVMEGYLTSSRQEAWVTADLQGRRVLFANETRQDGTVNEARLKQLTSYEPLTAAHKYGHPFTFVPTHKLWIRGNYRPTIIGTDEGIWRRIDLIAFEVTIPEEERDKALLEARLVPELPGILAWAVKGATEWCADGLREPPPVVHATEEYRQEEDILGRFMAERCQFGGKFRTSSKQLGAALVEWCEAEGVRPPSQKALSSRLKQHGLKSPKRSNGQSWWDGVALNDQNGAPHSADHESSR